MSYEAVIGLEVHAELLTRSKIFCGCANAFGGEPNSRVCPVCFGLPGALPVLNREVVAQALRAAIALNCRVNARTKFDRKNYFYPDLPKGYQISQFDRPLAQDGWLELGEGRRVGISRVHLEEDAGKSLHELPGEEIAGTLVDFNRCGVPLIEVVFRPDLRTPEQARLCLEKLRSILEYTGVSDAKMEEGSLRCDVNVSIRPAGQDKLGTRAEIKNLNSFRGVQRALEYEIGRQNELVKGGGRVAEETRRWDESQGRTVSMRAKEAADDYRYFPDPDLPLLEVDTGWVAELAAGLPELPDDRAVRFVRDYGLSEYDAAALTQARATADFFEAACAAYSQPKTVANWLMGEVARQLNLTGRALPQLPVTPAGLAELLRLIDQGAISGKMAKDVLAEMGRTGKSPQAIIQASGLAQISDTAELEGIVASILDANQGVVSDYRAGKTQALTFLVGQVMKATKGRANPELANQLLRKALG